jgi:hypothetical protein
MLFGRRHELCELLIAVLLCMPALAGQGTSSPSIMKIVSSNVSNASNETTSSSKVGYIYSSYFNVQEPSSLIRNYVFFSVTNTMEMVRFSRENRSSKSERNVCPIYRK